MSETEERSISAGDRVVLIDPFGKRYVLVIDDETIRIKGLGVYNPGKLIGTSYGAMVMIGSKKFRILPASTPDYIETLERKAQIILPKDSAHIILQCDIHSGSIVVEGGIGSGALATVLAQAVAPDGKVISYEQREDFAKIARRNLSKAALYRYVEIKIANINHGITEREVDAVVLDIPNPWEAVANAFQALRLGGYIACYIPTMNQVEKTVTALGSAGFWEVRTIETLQRELVVKKGGVRPSFDMLGHSGYTVFARKY